jgi:hypothetical protein
MAADTGRGAGNWVFLSITNEQRPAHPRATIDAATHTHTPSSCHTFYAFSSILVIYFFEIRYMNYADRKCVFRANRFRGKKTHFLKGKRTLCLRLDKYLSKFSCYPGAVLAEGFFFSISAGLFDFLEGICLDRFRESVQKVSGAENSPLASNRKSLYILSEKKNIKRIKVTREKIERWDYDVHSPSVESFRV